MEQLNDAAGLAKVSAADVDPSIIAPVTPARKKLGRGFWVFFAVAFFFDLGFAVYFFLFNLYLLDLHFNERSLGLVGGALTLGSVVGTLPAGWLGRKLGLRPLLAFFLVSAPILGIARALVFAEWEHIGLAFMAGLAMCLWGVCFLPMVAALTDEENRATAFGLIFSVSIGSSAVGELVCSYLPHWLAVAGFALQAAETKRGILIAACCVAMAGLIPWFLLRDPSQKSDPPGASGAGKRTREVNGFLVRFLPAMALWSAVAGAFASFSNVYLSKSLHIPLPQIGLVFSAAQVLQLCVGLMTPLFFRWLSLERGVLVAQVSSAIALGLLAGTKDRGLAIGLFLSFSATQWMSSPGLYNVLMSRVPPQERGWASAATLFCNAVVQSGLTACAGILIVRFDYSRTLAGACGLAAMAALLFAIFVAPARTWLGKGNRRQAAKVFNSGESTL